jgi:hypothetical protein
MTTLLDEALEAWDGTRNGLIAELENIPADRFDFVPAGGVRSVGELALHIAEVGLMMVGELTRDDGDFRRASYDKLIAQYRGPLDGVSGKRAIIAAPDGHQAGADQADRRRVVCVECGGHAAAVRAAAWPPHSRFMARCAAPAGTPRSPSTAPRTAGARARCRWRGSPGRAGGDRSG